MVVALYSYCKPVMNFATARLADTSMHMGTYAWYKYYTETHDICECMISVTTGLLIKTQVDIAHPFPVSLIFSVM